MQDYTHEDYDTVPEGASWLTRLWGSASIAIGATLAVSLLLGIGVWFYRLGVRDAQNVPIIRASLEPAKVRPADPGGLVTAHQDVTSYEVAESQPVQTAAAVVAPEPPLPDRDDVAMSVLAEVQAQQQAAALLQVPSAPAKPVTTATTQEATTTPAQSATPPVPQVTEAPVATPAPTETPEPEPEVLASLGTALAPGRSPVAPPRPQNLIARSEEAAREAEQQAGELVRQAARSAVQIQLAADPDETYIRNRWKQIYRANNDVLRGRELAVQTTVSGGKTFYRLRVGPFQNATEARNVCQALKARGQDCIVARNS